MGEGQARPVTSIGVAISGGGHRATLWGTGVLLCLVDLGVNAKVTTISSVSGGSIVNGVAGLRTDYATATSESFRKAIRPMLDNIMKDGIFFYGSRTNGYVYRLLMLIAATLSAWFVLIGGAGLVVVRQVLDAIGWRTVPPGWTISLWPIGITAALVFAGLIIMARLASKQWSWTLFWMSALVAAGGIGLSVWGLIAQPVTWTLVSALTVSAVAASAGTVLTLRSFALRSRVAEDAFRSVHFGDTPLSSLSAGRTSHVICATEMQSGLHACFSRDFVYSYNFGVSTMTEQVPLAFAVQASAALPGAFGPRMLETEELGFDKAGAAGAAASGEPMILLDGGVYDNMADQWFMGLDNRAKRWPPHLQDRIRPIDALIVANASTGWVWRPFPRLLAKVHAFREVRALTGVQSVMYNTIGRRRRRHLLDHKLARKDFKLAFVEVDDDPGERARDALADRTRKIAPGCWCKIVERSRTYPTVLRRIRRKDAMGIVWHAYVLTALALSNHLGVSVPETSLPTLSELEASLGVKKPAGCHG